MSKKNPSRKYKSACQSMWRSGSDAAKSSPRRLRRWYSVFCELLAFQRNRAKSREPL